MFVSPVTFSAPLQEFTGVHVAATTAAAKSVTYELQLDESVVWDRPTSLHVLREL